MKRLWALLPLALLALTQCSRDPEPAPGVKALPARAAPSSPAQGSATPPPVVPTRTPLRQRVIAIGDLHGDLEATRGALRLAGLIDLKDKWTGGSTVVVQTGDQLDRGDQERALIDFLSKLADDAQKAGGELHVLNGNHETMNAAGDFRYVTPGGFQEFADVKPAADQSPSQLAQFSAAERGRAAALLAGGSYAKRLADHPTVLVLGDTVFVHGGLLPEHVRYGIDRINREVSRFLRGEAPSLPPFLQRDDSPVWLRLYSVDPLVPGACDKLSRVLSELGVRRMVVGHSVQPRGITSACQQKVWRIDVGLARHYGGPRQVLEIHQQSVRVLGAPR